MVDDGVVIYEGLPEGHVINEVPFDGIHVVLPEEIEDVEIDAEVSPYGIELEEMPKVTSNIYDEVKVQREAEEFLTRIASFLYGLGRINGVNLVNMKAYEVEDGMVKRGFVKFAIRLTSDTFNRTTNIELEIPIYKGVFVKPTVFKSAGKRYIFSSDGVKKAFNINEEEHRKKIFPDYRQSRRFPLILDRGFDD